MFEAFQIGPVLIWMRLLFLLLAIWMSSEFFMRLTQSANLSLQDLKEFGKWFVLAFFLGGRLMAVFAGYQAYFHDPLRILIVWDGNFSFLGGAIGIAAVLFYVSRNQRVTFLQWLDVLYPATTFGLAFDWIGMFAAAQSYGKPTNLPWAVTVNAYNVRYAVPIHPIQLYYALFYLVLTFVLLLIRKYSKRAGSETLIGIVVASGGIFLLEFLRGDFGIPVYAMMTDFLFLIALFVSLGVLALLEKTLSPRGNAIYGASVALLTIVYVNIRQWIPLLISSGIQRGFAPSVAAIIASSMQLRFSQVLAVLALLATVVYVVVHRRKYPHL